MQSTQCTAGLKRVKLAVKEFTIAYDQYAPINIDDHPDFTSFGAFNQITMAVVLREMMHDHAKSLCRDPVLGTMRDHAQINNVTPFSI